MPKHRAEDHDLAAVRKFLKARQGLGHIRARSRSDLITLESGPKDDPYRHARIRRVSVHLWKLEMATHSGRWEPTPIRGQMDEVLTMLVDAFGWTLSPIFENPEGTSDPGY